MLRFILNNQTIATDLPPGMTLLDFIRYQRNLTGTKIGCREGDCGACTILVGVVKDSGLDYTTATSCLMPLGNADLKHIVTIEGINGNGLTPVQQAMSDEGATQCGFCTPGFIVSLTAFCLSDLKNNVTASVDGNICRCTGYKSIERAAEKIAAMMDDKKEKRTIDFAVEKNIVPVYFMDIKEKLENLISKTAERTQNTNATFLTGGGTDLYVQQHEVIKDADIHFLFDQKHLKGIGREGNICSISAAATVTDLKESVIIQNAFPQLDAYMKLVSSTPIRNMATIAGNFINASPIGDLTIFFLALDAELEFSSRSKTAGEKSRGIALRKLYKGYKLLDKLPDEYVSRISFALPDEKTLFNFEKVSKRTNLDIASVNSAIKIKIDNNIISEAGISAGGVGPVPMYLEKTSEFLKDKNISEDLVHQTIEIARSEISPISDARGSKEYKTLLLGQLIKAHFLKLFTTLETKKILLKSRT